MSATPRCLSSLSTCIQNFAPSVSWNHIPSTSRSPSTVTPEREVAGAALHRPALADLQHQRVEEDDRVDVLQRPLLPLADVVHDRVGDAADQVAADLDAVDLGQVRLDVARRQPARVEREDLVVEALETPLALPARSAARSCPCDPAASRSAPARARSQASSPSSRCGCCRCRRAAPGAARSRDARSARPPSPAPPAAGQTARAHRPARRSPPRVRAPASSSSITSSARRSRTSGGSSSTGEPAAARRRQVAPLALRARSAPRRRSPGTVSGAGSP